MSRKRLNEKQLNVLAENLSDVESLEDPFQDSGSEYIESEPDSDSESDIERPRKFRILEKTNARKPDDLYYSSSSESNENDITEVHVPDANFSPVPHKKDPVLIGWKEVSEGFVPRMKIPNDESCSVVADLNRGSSEMNIFMKLFPNSLFNYIAQCTNDRLEIVNKASKKLYKKHKPTDAHEIKIVIGCLFTMAYNKVPSMHHYWSTNKSLGNEAIKQAIFRDRFQLLVSKLYFTSPKKPENCSKLYYIEDVVNCLKSTFLKSRSESSHQSIDESMTKFKGRSALKQYLPLKPIKRGIKIWERCDAKSGYVYDFNIYCGKENEPADGTLGERVVKKLTSTVKGPEVSFCFDRFFTSVNLVDTLPFPAVGTCISSRKNMPKFEKKKRKRGEMESMENGNGTIGFLWQDTKEVMILSNCHKDKRVEISRKSKDGSKINLQCPEAIQFYNANMGGVDLSDQFTGLYEVDRKSTKWWKKVFYKLLLTTAVNAWIIYKELRNNPKLPFLSFLVNLAESLIATDRRNANVIRKRAYSRSNIASKNLINVGDHLPVVTKTRKRCRSCSEKKKEKRTTTICSYCNIPLCSLCFASYHT